MQTLEDDEDTIGELRVDADTIVTDRENPFTVFPPHTDMNARQIATAEFDGIAQQVLKKLHQLSRITLDLRQRFIGNSCGAFLDGYL